MAEKNVTFSFDCDNTPGPAQSEEIVNQNFTFHIDVPISDEEIQRWANKSIYVLFVLWRKNKSNIRDELAQMMSNVLTAL